MIHQPLGGAQGQASDIEITAREIQKLKKNFTTLSLTILKKITIQFGKIVIETTG